MRPILIKEFLTPDLRRSLSALFFLSDEVRHYYTKTKDGEHSYGGRGNTWNKYSPLWGDAVLLSAARKVMDAVGKNLTPSYSFVRLYNPGSDVPPHTDRPTCEYSVSICLASSEKDRDSELVIHYQDKPKVNVKRLKFKTEPGDAVIYTGAKHKHERRFIDEWYLGMFLHYVDTNGPYYFDFGYDGRAGARDLLEGVEKRLGLNLGPTD